jgi:hypothetical protein
MIHVELEGEFHPKAQCILDMRETMLQNQAIVQVKVKRKHFGINDATREMEDSMKLAYPILFSV